MVLAQDGGGGGMLTLLMIVALFAIMYFLLIRPQQKRRQAATRMQAELVVGDEVVTIGGLYGTIAEMDDETVILETSEGVYSRYARAAINRVISSQDDAQDESGAQGDDSSNPVIEYRDTKD